MNSKNKPGHTVYMLETDAEEGTSEFYHVWNEDKLRRKHERFENWERGGQRLFEEKTGVILRACTPYHYQATIEDSLFDYWPSSRKWRYHNRTHHGNLDAVIGFVNKRK